MTEIIENFDVNQQITLISAGAALLGAVIGALATLAATWLNKKVQSYGKISLYAKIVYSKGKANMPWGYYKGQDGLFMQVPIWLDVCNTCGISRIIRNINLHAYSGKDEVATFTQIQRYGDGEKAIPFGDNECYTLVIPANSARRYNLQFMLHEKELPPDKKAFDELILTYFDEKNNIQAFHFVKPNQCWIEGALKIEKQWISLDKKCLYAR